VTEARTVLLAIRRCRQRNDTAHARIEPLRDPLDDAALARGIPALEEQHQSHSVGPDLGLHLQQLDLQIVELPFVVEGRFLYIDGDSVLLSVLFAGLERRVLAELCLTRVS